MSAIDTQNAKQIRDPMDVLITLDLADDTVTCTFSDYGSAKVADGRLNVPTWPMRKLADLQGEGFPLNGEHVLYDPSTTPSARNGKLGVRSNVGQSVSVTVTGNKVMASLTLFATGAESVTFNGTTTPFTGSSIVIPVGATSITLTFNPASETERIVISDIQPGTLFRITNENLIKATVSLRSDLSIIDPTLPESEINIEVYQDTDISEAVANIPEDTPITYRAGYPGDMSPERKFYVTGQVTWADNVLTIQGVDAVHFLEIDVPLMAIPDTGTYSATYIAAFLFSTLQALGLNGSGGSVNHFLYTFREDNIYRTRTGLVEEKISLREFIAFWMNMIRYRDIDPAFIRYPRYGQNYIFDYVDAGIPTVRITPGSSSPQPVWTVLESDCGNCARNTEKRISSLKMATKTVWVPWGSPLDTGSVPVGTANWAKNLGVSLDFNTQCFVCAVAIPYSVLPNPSGMDWSPIAPMTDFGYDSSSIDNIKEESPFSNGGWRVEFILDNGIPNGTLVSEVNIGSKEYYGGVYSSFIPWGTRYAPEADFYYMTMQATWNELVRRGVIKSDDTTWSCDIRGLVAQTDDRLLVVGEGTEREAVEISARVLGSVLSPRGDSSSVGAIELYPTESMKNLLKRSPVTGSFTWKGDPRMQPRDLIEWERTDGNTEMLTVENITLTHEGGGTMAEITYRKGVV